MVVIQNIIDEIQDDIDYYINYQGLLQKWIVRKKHKNSKQLNALMEEYKQITNHISMIEEKKREYEKLLRRINKL
jgi:hypothetical protein